MELGVGRGFKHISYSLGQARAEGRGATSCRKDSGWKRTVCIATI